MSKDTFQRFAVPFLVAILAIWGTNWNNERNEARKHSQTLSDADQAKLDEFDALLNDLQSDSEHRNFEDFQAKAIEFRKAMDERKYEKALRIDNFLNRNDDFRSLVTVVKRQIDVYLMECADDKSFVNQSFRDQACHGTLQGLISPSIDLLEQSVSARKSTANR